MVADARPFLRATWRYLAMLNFEVPPALLRPRVPPGTELDDFEGVTLASVVGFRFLDTRVHGFAVPFHQNFDEVNLRFYVRRRADDGRWRRGVVFVRELVPRHAIAWVARWCYDEPYSAVPMRHEVEMTGAVDGTPGRVRYGWRLAGRWHELELLTRGRPAVPPPESEAGFIAEHYWGYTARRGGGCQEYQVAHPPWRVWSAASVRFDCDVRAVYGAAFAVCVAGAPQSAFLAEGSAVEVYPGKRLALQRPEGGAEWQQP